LTFELKIDVDALAFIKRLPGKSQTIIDGKIKTLKGNPFPGRRGDKELLDIKKGIKIYRIHISHRYTAFYRISKDKKIVYITDVMTIEQAHKKYGLL
jgi:mRNA-degrading endonuclease RelE of RelBE toxin-antitoxin system